MKNTQRLALYLGITIQIVYICTTSYAEIHFLLLASTALLILSGFINLQDAKSELQEQKSAYEISWETRRRRLQNYYSSDKNIDKTFAECLTTMHQSETQNRRISQILENYQTHNKRFKIILHRNPENRIDQYLED